MTYYSKTERRIRFPLKDQRGATMVEYALMVAFVAMVCVGAVTLFGANLNTTYATFAGLMP